MNWLSNAACSCLGNTFKLRLSCTNSQLVVELQVTNDAFIGLLSLSLLSYLPVYWICLSYPVSTFVHAPVSSTFVYEGPSDSKRSAATVLITPSPPNTTGSHYPHPWTKTLCHWHDPWNHSNREAEHVQKTQCHVTGGWKSTIYIFQTWRNSLHSTNTAVRPKQNVLRVI